MVANLLFLLPLCCCLSMSLGGCAALPIQLPVEPQSSQVSITWAAPQGYTYETIKKLKVKMNRWDGSATQEGLMELLRREAHAVGANAVLQPDYKIEFNPFGNIGRATGLAVRLMREGGKEPTVSGAETQSTSALQPTQSQGGVPASSSKQNSATPDFSPELLSRPLPARELVALDPNTNGTRWAIVIGVSSYKDTRVPSLRYAAADAQSFHQWLVSPTGGRYAPSRTKLLVDANATAKAIREALFQWSKQAIEEDVLTIFFAGHGSPESPDSPENLYLFPHDVEYDNIASTAFPMWDIETALKRHIRAKRVIVIADACHSGGVGQSFDIARREGRGLKAVPVSAGLEQLSDVSHGVCVVTASAEGEFSQEGKQWGGGHGCFTYYVLKGLEGDADSSGDGKVSLGELTLYVSQQVRRATMNAQCPIVAGRFDPALTIGK